MTTGQLVRVRVEATIVVDVDEWSAEYGCPPTATAVRRDLEHYAMSIFTGDVLSVLAGAENVRAGSLGKQRGQHLTPARAAW